MVQVYDVAAKSASYLADTGRKPRFLLLDKATYNAFTQSFIPKEKFELAINPIPTDAQRLSKLFLDGDIQLEVLEVNTTQHLFEVAG